MARARSERARSKPLAIDDLTQSIEQFQAFIPKLEDLGREGFPYLEGALTRTELQFRECIKRAFGDKSPEFQTHRHLKLSISSPTEKKQTVALIRSLIASLEGKKLELQGPKPTVTEEPAPSSDPPQMTLVAPAMPAAAAQVSVTSATTTSRSSGRTLHLVPSVDRTQPAEPPIAATPAPATTSTSSVVESTPPPAAPSPTQPIPPRTPIEPISSLFRTQETKPMPPAPEQSSPPPLSEPSQAAASTPSQAPEPPSVSPATPIASEAPASNPVSAPHADLAAAPTSVPAPETTSGTFSTTQEVAVPLQASVSQTPPPSPTPKASTADSVETDCLSITKKLCQRFHLVARQLRLRGEYRSTVNVEDEFDVQDLMHALLRQHFDDIGTDDWTPAYSNGASRTTFLLDHDRLAVVVKKTRTGLTRKDITDQLRADAERYRARGRCTHLLCFVYDPEGRIGNPRGLESELTSSSEHFSIDVFVAPK